MIRSNICASAFGHAFGAALIEEAVYECIFKWVIISSSRAARADSEATARIIRRGKILA